MKTLWIPIVLTVSFAPAMLRAQTFPRVPVPPGNPITTSKALLGKALFWDEQMSPSKTMACGTCHMPTAGGSDVRTRLPGARHPGRDRRFGTADDVLGSPGVVEAGANASYTYSALFGLDRQVTERRAMPVINAAFERLQFWDGRATGRFVDPNDGRTVLLQFGAALESQASAPPVNPVEMSHFGQKWADIARRIAGSKPLALASGIPVALRAFIGTRSYPDLFVAAFGSKAVTPARIVMAIATYERTLISNQSRFDQFVGGDRRALTPTEQAGLNRFNRVGCARCHRGPLLTDHSFANTGVRPSNEDPGRQNVTNRFADRGRFRVPGLRNVALRAPYFHNGRFATLNDVMDFYARGGDVRENLDRRMRRFRLSPTDRNQIVAFLQTLTDPRVRAGLPPFDRPKLSTETAMPWLYGRGTSGTGGSVPAAVAFEPASLGNATMSLGVQDALGGQPAVLAFDLQPSLGGRVFADLRIHLRLSAGFFIVPVGVLRGSGAGNGWTSTFFQVPANATLRNQKIYGQWLVGDPAGQLGLTSSEAFGLRLF